MSPVGKMLGGRYELLEKIGEGGMAVVYKAKCHLLNRYVAVKILRAELVENKEFLARFQRESQSAASLSHPNIVNIYDVGQEDEIHYIVMEYVDGKTLKEYIREKGRLTAEDTVRIGSQICSALHHAHSRNIIHRDIKPQNILLSEDGTVKVADFGIARAVTSATVTMAGADVIGSVHYFSPEQARGGHVDKKSDIYSLGIVLYEMVTGVVPFEGDSAVSVALKHIQEKVTPPGKINPDIPRSIQYIIERAIEKDCSRRYDDADEMRSDLKRALKEPDGKYVKRFVEDDQATRILPAIHDPGNPEEEQKGESRVGSSPEPEEKDAGKKHRRIGNRVIVGVIFVAFLVLFFLLRGIYLREFARKDTIVPGVVGYDEKAANKMLKGKGLVMKVVQWKNSDTVPKGQILFQDPSEGQTVKSDSSVEVTVSDGVKKVTVPDVVNLPQRNAEIKLEDSGLKVGTPEYMDSDKVSGYVVKQDPSAYTKEVPAGTEVRLFVSTGPRDHMTEVDKVVGLQEDMARDLLQKAGLDSNITREYNDEVEAGVVYQQSPDPGTNVEKGRKVDVWVSLGKKVVNHKKMTIELTGTSEKVRVQVIRASDDKVMYDEEHRPSDGAVQIPLEDSGVQSYAIWIDNVYQGTQTLDFSRKERERE